MADNEQSNKQEEGILSSDEEEQHPTETVTKSNKVNSEKPLAAQAEQSTGIKGFENTEGKLFESHRDKEEAENRYSFGEQDLEYFGAKMQTRAERDSVRKEPVKGEEEEGDRQFIEQTDYDQDKLDKMDVASLNLFGIPLEEAMGKDSLKDAAGTNAETQKILRELIDLAQEVDGGSLADFSLRKSFVYYDPYEPSEAVQATTYLKFEDQSRVRASIVLDVYKKEVESLKDDDLSFADKERKKHVLNLIDYLGGLKIVDAQVLFKLYELYRFKV